MVKGWTKFYYCTDIQFETGEAGWEVGLVSRNKNIGTAKLSLHPRNDDWLELCSLEIKPEFQGQGYGTELLKALDHEFGDRYSKIYLVAQPYKPGLDRDQLEAFYLKNGYTRQRTVGSEEFPVLAKPI